jgi:hypothetical protein
MLELAEVERGEAEEKREGAAGGAGARAQASYGQQQNIRTERLLKGYPMNVVIVIALTLLWEFGGCENAEMRRGASVIYARRWDAWRRYGSDFIGVCLKPRAFSCWTNRQQDAENVQRYADQAAEADAALWFRCVELATKLTESDFRPTIIATHYWQHDAPGVSAGMAALPEVLATEKFTYRKEE